MRSSAASSARRPSSSAPRCSSARINSATSRNRSRSNLVPCGSGPPDTLYAAPTFPETTRRNTMSGPLSGIRVLDLTGVVSGPFATMFLSDQGADVLKIEPIGGGITRRSRATIGKAGALSALFISSNRGKRSLSIDVKSTVGREVLARLVAEADVLVQNFRPGAMERLGLGADELRQRHPRLIYVSISGVGDTGPYVKKRVYDPIIQGLSGFADI